MRTRPFSCANLATVFSVSSSRLAPDGLPGLITTRARVLMPFASAAAYWLRSSASEMAQPFGVQDWKKGEIIAGGNSVGLVRNVDDVSMAAYTPIQEWAKKVKIAELGSEEKFLAYKAEKKGYEAESSSADSGGRL